MGDEAADEQDDEEPGLKAGQVVADVAHGGGEDADDGLAEHPYETAEQACITTTTTTTAECAVVTRFRRWRRKALTQGWRAHRWLS